jgi:hypothetical protein
MHYPDISPDLKLKSTVSHPIRSEEVIGFIGRNTMLGREAIVMKEDAVDGNTVTIPLEAGENLVNGNGELAVLYGDKVLTMNGTDFALEHEVNTIEGRGSTSEILSVSEDSENFRSWKRSVVEVEN